MAHILENLMLGYFVVAFGSLVSSAGIRSETRADERSFWIRNNIALSALWPFTLVLLAVDAGRDFVRNERNVQERRRLEAELAETKALRRSLREAQRALDADLHAEHKTHMKGFDR